MQKTNLHRIYQYPPSWILVTSACWAFITLDDWVIQDGGCLNATSFFHVFEGFWHFIWHKRFSTISQMFKRLLKYINVESTACEFWRFWWNLNWIVSINWWNLFSMEQWFYKMIRILNSGCTPEISKISN